MVNGVIGMDVENDWLGRREEKGKRPDGLAGEGEGGCSNCGVGGLEGFRTGEGERRMGNAERKLLEGRLDG